MISTLQRWKKAHNDNIVFLDTQRLKELAKDKPDVHLINLYLKAQRESLIRAMELQNVIDLLIKED